MIGHLYRYPHPCDQTKFIYCGQGAKRDAKHRYGRSSFGRRFKKLFPDVDLPQPIREQVEVSGQLELNELETIWMFRFHTWRGYPDGMNLTLPGSDDYKAMANLGASLGGKSQSREAKVIGGRIQGSIQGRKNVESGQIQSLGRIYGRIEVKSGLLERIRTPEHQSKAAAEAGRKALESGQIQALGRKQGLISGRKAVESGHLSRIQSAGGCAGGRKAVESGQIITLGRVQGRKNVESGHLTKILTPEVRSRGGRTSGRKAVESGQLASIQKLGSVIGLCMRWNIRRGKPCTCRKHSVVAA
jgi:hypothetical protein